MKSCAREFYSCYLPLTVKTFSFSFMESSSVSGSCFDFVHTFQILIKQSWAQLAKKRSSPICFQKKKKKKNWATFSLQSLPWLTYHFSIHAPNSIIPIFPIVHSIINRFTVLFQHQLTFPLKFSTILWCTRSTFLLLRCRRYGKH